MVWSQDEGDEDLMPEQDVSCINFLAAKKMTYLAIL